MGSDRDSKFPFDSEQGAYFSPPQQSHNNQLNGDYLSTQQGAEQHPYQASYPYTGDTHTAYAGSYYTYDRARDHTGPDWTSAPQTLCSDFAPPQQEAKPDFAPAQLTYDSAGYGPGYVYPGHSSQQAMSYPPATYTYPQPTYHQPFFGVGVTPGDPPSYAQSQLSAQDPSYIPPGFYPRSTQPPAQPSLSPMGFSIPNHEAAPAHITDNTILPTKDYPMGSGINWSKTQRRYDDKDRQTIFDIRQPPEVQGRSYEGTTYGPYVTAGQTDSLQANVWSSNQPIFYDGEQWAPYDQSNQEAGEGRAWTNSGEGACKNTFFIGLLLYLNKLADIMTDRNDYLDNLPGHFKDYAGPSQVFSNQIEDTLDSSQLEKHGCVGSAMQTQNYQPVHYTSDPLDPRDSFYGQDTSEYYALPRKYWPKRMDLAPPQTRWPPRDLPVFNETMQTASQLGTGIVPSTANVPRFRPWEQPSINEPQSTLWNASPVGAMQSQGQPSTREQVPWTTLNVHSSPSQGRFIHVTTGTAQPGQSLSTLTWHTPSTIQRFRGTSPAARGRLVRSSRRGQHQSARRRPVVSTRSLLRLEDLSTFTDPKGTPQDSATKSPRSTKWQERGPGNIGTSSTGIGAGHIVIKADDLRGLKPQLSSQSRVLR